MEIPDWPFQAEFEKLFVIAQQYGIQHQNVMTDELPLIRWEGSTDAVAWLGNPDKQPPDDVINPARIHPNEVFLCWLMLPKDYSGNNWYFGRVYSTRNSLPDELQMFQDMADEGGSLLRRDSLFREYLAPCVQHIQLVDRFPQLQSKLNASYLCALLFARPEFDQRIQFPYEKSIAGKTIGEAHIANPFKQIARVTVRWQLSSARPMPATGRIARPYQWPNTVTMPSLARADERLLEPHFVSVVGHDPIEGFSESQVTVTSPTNFAQLPDHGGVISDPQTNELLIESHDGPLPPSQLRANGKTVELEPKPYKLVEFFWNRPLNDRVLFDTVAQKMWKPNQTWTPGGFANAVTKANAALLEIGVPWSLSVKGDFVRKI